MKLRVAMLEPGGWGGICHYAYNQCCALAEQGTDLTLITNQNYELQDRPTPFTLAQVIDPSGPYSQNLRKILHVLRQVRPHILHIHSTLSARRDWAALLASRLLPFRVVLTVHNVLPHDQAEREAPGLTQSLRLIYRLAHGLIVHSQQNRNDLQNRFLLPPGRIHVIPHGDYSFARGTNTAHTSAEARTRLGYSAEHRVILCFGTLRPYKGIHDLIPAFAHVVKSMPQARLLIAGKPMGVDPAAYRAQIATLELQDTVQLHLGYVPMAEIEHYFQAADLVVFPYTNIYQSGALQLAYAFAKPVVATTVGSFPETVRDGENGKLVPPEDPITFAHAMLDILNQPDDVRQKMGERSLHLAQSQYGWPEIATRTVELYRRVQALRDRT
ncbi:MAG: glycosyltransferase family 4 protein [bacterium]|nr:glycosyltransferase family 4 protein [bacterium]